MSISNLEHIKLCPFQQGFPRCKLDQCAACYSDSGQLWVPDPDRPEITVLRGHDDYHCTRTGLIVWRAVK